MQVPHDMTLLESLQHFYPDSSKRTLTQWLNWDRVSVDGVMVKIAKTPLKKGQLLEVGEKKEPQFCSHIPILHQDRACIVIDKPASLLSVATDNPLEEHALHFLREHYKTAAIYPVHRLDRDTSGVLLFARGKLSQDYFDTLFETHDIQRQYLAIVEGRLTQDKGTWKSYLKELENYNVVVSTEEEGKLAITHFEVLRRSKKFTYLKLTLETGKKHQIRVHCKEAGHPIVGDKRYGSTCNPISRLGLHAAFLSFVHPVTKKTLSFSSNPPRAFSKLGSLDL